MLCTCGSYIYLQQEPTRRRLQNRACLGIAKPRRRKMVVESSPGYRAAPSAARSKPFARRSALRSTWPRDTGTCKWWRCLLFAACRLLLAVSFGGGYLQHQRTQVPRYLNTSYSGPGRGAVRTGPMAFVTQAPAAEGTYDVQFGASFRPESTLACIAIFCPRFAPFFPSLHLAHH